MDPNPSEVAVIGLACKFPGIDGPEEYWETLKNGKNHISEIPEEDRWNIDAFVDENPNATGKTYTKRAGLIHGIYDWDNVLFNINEVEAKRMDPQQKLALEITYKALENAGLTEDKVKGSDTAVYMGQMNDDFSKLVGMDTNYADAYTATGTAMSLTANRISYIFDLRGPSITMDTACSSSLVAVNCGVNSILKGESKMAVCGGVNLILTPVASIALCKANMASKDGQCYAFSEKADGYVRSEGCGIVILKDAQQAIRDQNNIWGFITCACNSDGRDQTPITSPSTHMQKDLVVKTTRLKMVDLHQIQYVEMHGTGTKAGDRVEVKSVGDTIGLARKKKQLPPVKIGSVKTNIGHTEASAGTAGLIKTLLMMDNGLFVPSLFTDQLNQNINFNEINVEVVDKVCEWAILENGERVASVNCFGFGGTNVHAIIREKTRKKVQKNTMPFNVICFSGKTENSVQLSMQDTLNAIQAGHIHHLSEVQFTSMNHRKHYRFRKAIVLETYHHDCADVIESFQRQMIDSKIVKSEKQIYTIFVFCGMGTHWEKMGLAFYENIKVFCDTINDMDEMFYPLAGYKLSDCLRGQKDLDKPEYGQPAIFAVQVGLIAMLRHFGIEPDTIVGHSVGEIAAAVASNAISLKNAVNIIYYRSKLIAKVQEGAMLAVGEITLEQLQNHIKYDYKESASIAAYNSGNSFTVSISKESVESFENMLQEKHPGIFVKRLNVKAGYHSMYMDSILGELEKVFKEINFSPVQASQETRHISTVSCSDDKSQFANASYWIKNVRHPVMFEKAFESALLEGNKNLVIEIGPRAPLRRYIQELAQANDRKLKYIATMKVDCNVSYFYSVLGNVFEEGKSLVDKVPSEINPWPKYGHDKKKFKLLPPNAIKFLQDENTDRFEHAFISKEYENGKHVCSISEISLSKVSFIFDHKIEKNIVVPGVTYIEAAAATYICQIHREIFRRGKAIVLSAFFKRPCLVSDIEDNKVKLTTTLFPNKVNGVATCWEYDITTPNVLHATGELMEGKRYSRKMDISLLKSRCTQYFKKKKVYSKLKDFKFNHGPKLQCIVEGCQNRTEILAEVCLNEVKNHDKYIVHPVLLDSILQLCVMLPAANDLTHGQVIPYGIKKVVIQSSPPERVQVYVKLVQNTPSMLVVDGEIFDKDGQLCVSCHGVTVGVVGKVSMLNMSDTLFHQSWINLNLQKLESSTMSVKCVLISNYIQRTKALLSQNGLADFSIELKNPLENDSTLDKMLPATIGEYSDILYAFDGSQIYSDKDIKNLEGEEVSNLLTDVCFSLIQIIRYLQEHYPKLQISVLTTQVYETLEGGNPNNMISGLIGNALWGMMRSVKIERPFQKFKMIDVSDFEKETIDSILLMLRTHMTVNEVNIRKGEINECHFKAMLQPQQLKMVPFCTNDTFVVCANEFQQRCDGWTLNFKTDNTNDISYIKVEVHDAYILKQSVLFNLPELNINEKQPLTFIAATGHHYNKGQLHVVALLHVCNKVKVSPDLLIPMTEFSSKLPSVGLWLFAWILINRANLRKQSKICVMNTRDNNAWASAIVQMALIMKYERSNCSKANYFIVANNSCHVACLLDGILEEYVESLSVLTFKIESKTEIHRYLQTHNIKALVICLEEYYSDTEVLIQKIKEFRKWLRGQNKSKLQESINEVDLVLKEKCVKLCDYVSNDCTATLRHKSQDVVLYLRPIENKQLMVTLTKSTMYRKDAGYLVVGGSKGQGWEIVTDIAAKGAGKIGIISRNGITSEDKQHKIKEIEKENGCTIIDLKADISNYQQLQKIKEEFNEKEPQKVTKGIFVGAVVTDDAVISNMTLEKFRFVQKAKVTGLLNINRLFEDESLEFFVANSSLSSMIGNPGQTNYAAANAFVDAFMCQRRKTFGVGQSICWGALDLGLLKAQTTKNKVMSLGLGLFNREEILDCLDHCLLFNPVLSSYAKFNWDLFIKQTSPIRKLHFQALFERKGHYLDSQKFSYLDVTDKTRDGKEPYLTSLLKSIMMLDDDLNYNIPLRDQGADSQNGSHIYSGLLDEYGQLKGLDQVTLLEKTPMDLQEMISKR